jgi:RNA polymerase sigma factor (TIGR02999 family)
MLEPNDQPVSPGEVTRLLNGLRNGHSADRERLFAVLYGELRHMARKRMPRGGSGATLQPTMLVHEALLRLLGRESEAHDRGHFLALAARAMRDVIVDRARQQAALKRGGAYERCALESDFVGPEPQTLDVLAIHEALEALAEVDKEGARAVELRAFGGLSIGEIAQEMGWSPSSADRRLAFARAWLARRLANGAV